MPGRQAGYRAERRTRTIFRIRKTPPPTHIESKTAYFVWLCFDFHPVPECNSDVAFAVDGDEIDKALKLRRIEFRYKIGLFPQDVEELDNV